jgi:hypothetical protein
MHQSSLLKSFDLLIRIPEKKKKKKKLRQKNGLEPRHPCLGRIAWTLVEISIGSRNFFSLKYPLFRPSDSLLSFSLSQSTSISASSLVYPTWNSIQLLRVTDLTHAFQIGLSVLSYFIRSKSIVEGIKVFEFKCFNYQSSCLTLLLLSYCSTSSFSKPSSRREWLQPQLSSLGQFQQHLYSSIQPRTTRSRAPFAPLTTPQRPPTSSASLTLPNASSSSRQTSLRLRHA